MSLSLRSVQRKSLEIRRHNEDEARAERIGDPFEPGELGFRIVYTRDAGLEERRAWLGRLLVQVEPEFRYTEFDSFIFSARPSDYNVAIVHSVDWRRLSGAIELNNALLFNRVAIALVNEATPARRAALLMAGYDDVFDLRMALSEARARIRRHVIRLTATRNRTVLEGLGVADWPKGVSALLSPAIERAGARFTPRERIIFGSLFGSFGRIVQYSVLLRAYEVRELKNGSKSLRVAISGLRRKLEGLFTIKAHVHEGYELQLVAGLNVEHMVQPLSLQADMFGASTAAVHLRAAHANL